MLPLCVFAACFDLRFVAWWLVAASYVCAGWSSGIGIRGWAGIVTIGGEIGPGLLGMLNVTLGDGTGSKCLGSGGSMSSINAGSVLLLALWCDGGESFGDVVDGSGVSVVIGRGCGICRGCGSG